MTNRGGGMQSRANKRVVLKQIAFTVTALLIGAVYASAVFASIAS